MILIDPNPVASEQSSRDCCATEISRNPGGEDKSGRKFVVDFYWPGFIIIFLHQLAELLCGTYLLFIQLPCRKSSLVAGIGEFFLSESSTCQPPENPIGGIGLPELL
jgi:hypothetical protein